MAAGPQIHTYIHKKQMHGRRTAFFYEQTNKIGVPGALPNKISEHESLFLF